MHQCGTGHEYFSLNRFWLLNFIMYQFSIRDLYDFTLLDLIVIIEIDRYILLILDEILLEIFFLVLLHEVFNQWLVLIALLRLEDLIQNLVQFPKMPHLHHPVSLVHHQKVQLIQMVQIVVLSRIYQIHQPSRSRDHYIRSIVYLM